MVDLAHLQSAERRFWRRAKQEIILWLANGKPYTVNTSVQVSVPRITIQDITMIGKPGDRPFVVIGNDPEDP